MKSIRRRLIIIILGLVTLVGSITILLSYKDARHEVGELFDAQLTQSAKVLDALVLNQLNNPEVSKQEIQAIQNIIDHIVVLDEPGFNDKEKNIESREAAEYERKIAFQIWSKDKNLFLRSASAPDTPLSVSSLNKNLSGYFDEVINGKRWRVYSIKTEDRHFLMQVGEQYDIRNELSKDISEQLVKTSVLSLPILAVLIWFAISKSLLPLNRITKEVTKRSRNNFNAINIQNVPDEIEPLILSINNLLERLQIAFENEQRFTDDAAHELRTPLAALKTQAQVALSADNTQDKQHALEKIIQGVERASHLVDQMLTIARLESITEARQEVSLEFLVTELLEQFADEITKKELQVKVAAEKEVFVKSIASALRILLNNLIDNAIRYSPDKGHITIEIHSNGRTGLTVENDAVPLSKSDIERIFDRFYRVSGTGTTGCGLGLAIAKQISDILGVSLIIENKKDNTGVVSRLVWS